MDKYDNKSGEKMKIVYTPKELVEASHKIMVEKDKKTIKIHRK